MVPSRASRSDLRAAEAMPRSLSNEMALSMSPLASVRARLQSIIPAPVRSRSSFTFCAEMSIVSFVKVMVVSRASLGRFFVLFCGRWRGSPRRRGACRAFALGRGFRLFDVVGQLRRQQLFLVRFGLEAERTACG